MSRKQTKNLEPLAYSIIEFAQVSGISRATVYHEIKAGNLNVCKVGDRTLIEVDEAKRWIASKRQRAA